MSTDQLLEQPTRASADETWITIPEAARLRHVREHKFYAAIKYGWLKARQVQAQPGRRVKGFNGFGWRWEVKLADVMAMTFVPKVRRGATGRYSGPPREKTLDRLMDAIEEVWARNEDRRPVLVYQRPRIKPKDEEQLE